MADPRAGVKEYRGLSSGIELPATVDIPAVVPTPEPTEPPRGDAEVVTMAPRPSRARGERLAAAVAPEPDGDDRVPGSKRGNRRAITVVLPIATATALREANESGNSTYGRLIMSSLRSSWTKLTDRYRPQVEEIVGPFGPSEIPPRRPRLKNPSHVNFTVSEADARAIGEAARQCGVSPSELVTDALDIFLGVHPS